MQSLIDLLFCFHGFSIIFRLFLNCKNFGRNIYRTQLELEIVTLVKNSDSSSVTSPTNPSLQHLLFTSDHLYIYWPGSTLLTLVIVRKTMFQRIITVLFTLLMILLFYALFRFISLKLLFYKLRFYHQWEKYNKDWI